MEIQHCYKVGDGFQNKWWVSNIRTIRISRTSFEITFRLKSI